MMRRVAVLMSLFVLVFFPVYMGRAQSQDQMTNSDVLEMVKAKLSAGAIVKAIESASSVNFDLKPQSLIGLKQAGVDDRIIEAMQKKASPAQETASRSGAPREKPSVTSSYEDGYAAGYLYGGKLRRDKEFVYGQDIMLPGSMIHDMTIKLGPIEYEKWEQGYLSGFDDGYRGRKQGTTAAASSGPGSASDPTSAEEAIKGLLALHQHAVAKYSVRHAHAGAWMMSPKEFASCLGVLYVFDDRIEYTPAWDNDGQRHPLAIPRAELVEIALNRMSIAGFSAFHLKTTENGNFNFVSKEEPRLIVATIKKAAGKQ